MRCDLRTATLGLLLAGGTAVAQEAPETLATVPVEAPAAADTVPVGQLAGTSGYGVEDMAGNVAEWVNDLYSASYYAAAPAMDPPGATTGTHVRPAGA